MLKKKMSQITAFDKILSMFSRSGNVMHPFDFGIIVAVTGIGPNSKIVEAGTGSACLTSLYSHIVGEKGSIITFEINKTAFNKAKRNLDIANAHNVIQHNKSLSEADEKEVDLVSLDLPNPVNFLGTAKKILKRYGWIAVYTPFIEDARSVQGELKDIGFSNITTLEPLIREFEMAPSGSRGKTQFIGQARYLTFGKKE